MKWLKGPLSSHVGPEDLGDADATVLHLVLFHYGYQGSARGHGGRVERVDRRIALSGTVSHAQPIGLVVGAVGTRDDLLVVPGSR